MPPDMGNKKPAGAGLFFFLTNNVVSVTAIIEKLFVCRGFYLFFCGIIVNLNINYFISANPRSLNRYSQ